MDFRKYILTIVLSLSSQFSWGQVDAPTGLIQSSLSPSDEFYFVLVGSTSLDGAQIGLFLVIRAVDQKAGFEFHRECSETAFVFVDYLVNRDR